MGNKNACLFISSLICYPAHFPSISIPQGNGTNMTSSMVCTPQNVLQHLYNKLREATQTTVVAALGSATSPDLRAMCLWTATVCIFENITHFP